MRNIHRLSYFALVLGLLAACGRTEPQPWPTGYPTGEDLWTPTPTSTVTPTASATSTPTETLFPTPIVPLSQKGPWLLLYSDDFESGIWAANPDGTGLTLIAGNETSPGYQGYLRLEIAPHGGHLAFFYPAMIPDYMVAAPPELMLVTLPSVVPQRLTPLHSGESLPAPMPGPDSNGDVFAAVQWSDPVWSPDGSLLAFVSAQDGPSSDLYVYATRTGTITRLTDGPTQAIDPSWSPDGRYIISSGASDMNFGAGGSNGPVIDTVWAVRPDGGDLRVVHTYPSDDLSPPSLQHIGWVNNRAYLDSYGEMGCGDFNLTFVDFLTPHQYTILPGAFTSLGLDPATGTLLVLIPKRPADYDYMLPLCGPSPEPGWYLVSVYGAKPMQGLDLEIPPSPDTRDEILGWSPQAKVFFVSAADRLYAVDLSGKVSPIDVPDPRYDVPPAVSPDGEEWAIPGYSGGLWVASPDHSAIEIFTGNVSVATWTPDGSAILFISEGTLYRATAPDYLTVALFEVPAGELEWVMP